MKIGRRHSRAIAAGFTLGLAAFSGATLAAQPRASITIRSSSVRLSDLFSGLSAGQDCDIGPAPAPGRRINIDQPQLTAIAGQFGVDWQPGAFPAQVVIERGGRSVVAGELLPLIRSALMAAGAPESSDVSLSTYVTLVVPAETTSQPDIESLNYERASGRFTAQLLFNAPGADPMRLRVTGTAQEMIDVPVLVHNMSAGSVITSSDLQIKRLRKSLVGNRALLTAEDGTGLALRHRMVAGNFISLDELSRPLLIFRGMSVVLRLEDTGLVLLAKGEAIEGGALDDRIHVLNPSSRAVLVARVTGSGMAQVDPTSAPILLASQQSGLPPPYGLATVTQPLNR